MRSRSRSKSAQAPAESRCSIAVSGSYGGMNLGDEAILQTITEALRGVARDPRFTVFSRDPEDTVRRHRVERAVDPAAMSRADARALVSTLDLFVLGGGGILYDGDAERYLREVSIALDAGVPVLVYAIGAGPLVARHTRTLVRETLDHVDAITVRDRRSQQLLEDLGIRQPIELAADPAFRLRAEPISLAELRRREAIDPERALVAFSVREPGPAAPDLDVPSYHRLLANAADFVVDRLEADVVFVPMERRVSDVQHSHGVIASMRHAHRATVLHGDYRPGQLVSLLRRFRLAIGMRLHFLIFAALADLPIVALPYAAKVQALVDDLGIEGSSAQESSAGQLIAHVDRVWDERERQRATVRGALAELVARARRPSEIAARILGEPRAGIARAAG